MVLHGRITVYGEYLMHGTCEGLVVPSSHVLASEDETRVPLHPDYAPRHDSVALLLAQHGIRCKNTFRGTLPLGYGLGSSSILCRLHIGTQLVHEIPRLIDAIDAVVHGFAPSGLDSGWVQRQRPGLYMDGCWRDIPKPSLQLSLMFLEKECGCSLAETRARVLQVADDLAPLAEQMSHGLLTSGAIRYDYLLRYSEVLAAAGVYATGAQHLVTHMLSYGIATKGVGGLYDKALLVIRPSRSRTP